MAAPASTVATVATADMSMPLIASVGGPMTASTPSSPADHATAGDATGPTLRRGVSPLMSFSISLTAVNCVSSLVTVYALGLVTGGPVVMIWGWTLVALGFVAVGAVLAEVCSAYPAAGGVYHWTGQLAPGHWGPALSYVCGWASYLANTGANATFAYSFASMCSALAAAIRAPPGAFDLSPGTGAAGALEEDPFTGFSSGETVGLALAALAAWAMINGLRIDQQGWVNNFGAFVQIVTTIAVTVAVLALAPSLNAPSFVFTEFYNGTGWSNTAYVVMLGLLYSLFAFTGFDAGGQLAEETQDPSRAAPIGMLVTCIATALIGFTMTVALLFATVDIGAILYNPYVGLTGANQPIVALFYYAVGDVGGAALSALVILNLFLAGVSTLTATSRIAYALARDGGLPGATYISHISPYTGTPLLSVLMVFTVDAAVLLVTLSSTSAIYNVSSKGARSWCTCFSRPRRWLTCSDRVAHCVWRTVCGALLSHPVPPPQPLCSSTHQA